MANRNENLKHFNDIHGLIDKNGKRTITLKKICDIIGVALPPEHFHMKDYIVENVATRYKNVTEGCAFFMMQKKVIRPRPLPERIAWLSEIGVKVLFVETQEYEKYDLTYREHGITVIPIEDVNDKVCIFFSYIKELTDVKTVAVTGTCGKTTTMQFINNIVPDQFKAYINKGNSNSYMSVANNILNRVKPEHELYIQETGAASVDSLRKSARILSPDAFILLNVFEHHLDDYFTFDNLFNDKISFDDYLKENGVVITNYDDEKIAAHKFKHQVISFGIHTDEKVDYRGMNIEQNEGMLEMDILYDNTSLHISTAILGVQNAYNILATFALCKWLGISDADIIKGFKKFKSSGYRQNFKKVGSHNLLLDCYNICEDSLKADLSTIKDIHVGDNNKRIIVITGENRLGKDAEAKSFDLGKSLDLTNIDYVICVGLAEETEEGIYKHCHTRPVYEGIKSTGYSNVVYVSEEDDLDKAIMNVVEEGDLILFKGIYSMDLAPAADRAFGTAICMDEPYYSSKAKKLETSNYICNKIKQIKGVDIIGYRKKDFKKISIPSRVPSRGRYRVRFLPVYRIMPKLFKNQKGIEKLSLGRTVVNIGEQAFYGCSGIRKLTIPSSVRVIEDKAFSRCTELEMVRIKEGVCHVGNAAFSKCNGLKSVYIPDSVKYIGEDAFAQCADLTIYCKKDSYADIYAQKKKISVSYL